MAMVVVSYSDLEADDEFIVRVLSHGSFMYWTLSGSTVDLDKAAVYTLDSMCDLHKSVLRDNGCLQFILIRKEM